ncbi:MAG: hypothetical protein ABIR06_22585 [Cyclobacteriaceae bacterium]
MALNKIYVHSKGNIFGKKDLKEAEEVVTLAMWTSEPIPFDLMEKSLHDAYSKICEKDQRPQYQLVREYPLSGKPPIMTDVFQNESGNSIIAVKGAPEGVIRQSTLSNSEKKNVLIALDSLTFDGLPGSCCGCCFRCKGLPAKSK